jgi:GntR family transcriptional regulator / MocR family aminotransferase
MTKTTTPYDLTLPERDKATPAYQWLCTALRGDILEGRLAPGARLPATRDLARQHGLSRGTVVSAFDQLKAEGYVEGTVGSGTYVSRILPDDLLQVRRDERRGPAQRLNRSRNLSAFAGRIKLIPAFGRRAARAFRANQPALDLFPTTLWAKVAARRLRKVSPELLLGCEPMGYAPLREAVAEYLNTSRGVKCEAQQVAIVSGAQEAIDLTARLFLNPADRVCVEDPGYDGAVRVFESLGAHIVPNALDGEGMVVPSTSGRLAYLTPGHQFPTGVTMSLPRRLTLLEWARANNVMIIEDDYDSEYRYAGRPVPAMQGLDRHGLVLFIGSFSKVFFPSLRLGYLVVPPDLVDHVAAAISMTSRHAPLLNQAILADFIREGHFGRHIRKMRQVYATRAGVLTEEVRRHLKGVVEVTGVEAGLQTVGWLNDGIDGLDLARAAAKRSVEVIALSTYCRSAMLKEGVQLGFAAVDEEEIRRGVRDLALAIEDVRQMPGA